MATLLYIGGVNVGRYAIALNQLSLSMDGPDSLAFTQLATRLPGAFRKGQTVILVVDGAVVFVGPIVSLHPSGVGSGPINIGYRCLGLNWLANQVWVTAADGSGRITFNLPSTDPNYVPSMSGMSVGAILTYVYDLHAAALAAVGITGFSGTDLAPLQFVPPDPVIFMGRLWNNVLELITTWYNSYGAYIVPGGTAGSPTGTIRHQNLQALPTTTFTLDQLDGSSNPCVLESISEDFSECYTRVVVRGGNNIQGAYLSLTDEQTVAIGQGMLNYAWSPAQQAAWNWNDFINPPGASEQGTINSMTATTLSVTATAPIPITYGSTSWWSALGAEVWAYTTVGGSAFFNEQRRIISQTIPSGNTYTMTVDSPFNNNGYTGYQIRGRTTLNGITTLADVWRKFWITSSAVADALEQLFSHSFPWSGGSPGVVVQTLTPMGEVITSTFSTPAQLQVVPWGTGAGYFVQATGYATVSGTSPYAVTGLTLTTGGAGYPVSSSTIAVVITGVGTGATATATSNSSGVITGLTLTAGGTGYTTAPLLSIPVAWVQATATVGYSGGAVTSLSLSTGGSGNQPSQGVINCSFTGGGGSGAVAYATSSAAGVITGLTLVYGGSGYTTAPTIDIGVSTGYIEFYAPICAAYASSTQLAAGGSAIANPADVQVLVPYSLGPIEAVAPIPSCTTSLTVVSGVITAIGVVSGGGGYPPSTTGIPVYIFGFGGSGASAYATSNSSGAISSITVLSGGSGYLTAPWSAYGAGQGVWVEQFSGAAYSVNGVQRTYYMDYPEWLDYANQSNYNLLAAAVLATVCNTVIEGSLVYYGKQATFFTLGQALNITGNGYTTGYESINAPARSVVLDWLPDGGAAQWVTRIGFSTRMKPFTGDRLYVHPGYGSQQRGAGFGGAMAAGIGAKFSQTDFSGGMMDQDDQGGNQGGGFGQPGQNKYKRKETAGDQQRTMQHERAQAMQEQRAARIADSHQEDDAEKASHLATADKPLTKDEQHERSQARKEQQAARLADRDHPPDHKNESSTDYMARTAQPGGSGTRDEALASD